MFQLAFLNFGRLRLLTSSLALTLVLQGLVLVSMPMNTSQSSSMMEMHYSNNSPCPDCAPTMTQDCISLCAQNTGIFCQGAVNLFVALPSAQRPSYPPFLLAMHEPFAQPPPVPPIVALAPLPSHLRQLNGALALLPSNIIKV